MKITKEAVLENLEEVKKYIQEVENKKEETVKGIAIMSRYGGIKFQSTKTTFKEAVVEGKANLSSADLYGADLYGADLRGADLYGADLRGANLYGADLRGADLYGADLSGANLSGANLYCADLRSAELNNVKFYGRGGNIVIKKANLEGFLGALGFKLEE